MMTDAVPPHGYVRVLACVPCQRRKIKCDRSLPCANCVKTRATCTPGKPTQTRKRRRPNQDLQERLSRCEELIKQVASSPASPRQPGQPPSSPMSTNRHDSWRQACKIVDEDGSGRFMDSYICASVSEEASGVGWLPDGMLQAMRHILEREDAHESGASENLMTNNNSDLFFPSGLSTVTLDHLQPGPVHSFKLWQLFLDRVDPLTKTIHTPTVQRYVVEAATSISSLPLNHQALLFSIYTMAIISVSDAECIQMFSISRDIALQNFTAGTKAALTRFDILHNYDMSVLQALVLYLYSLQRRYNPHAAWILSGTIVCIAQKMGYHRDGEQLNLEPFEIEMRRRIWWQIVIQASKYAELSGLKQTMLPLRWDTKMPHNVNDADIFPGSTDPIQPRQGPTEMAFCLMFNEVFRFKVETDNADEAPAFEAAMLGEDMDGTNDPAIIHQTDFKKFRNKINAHKKKLIELENKYVDINAGNVHSVAMIIRSIITKRLDEMLVPLREQPEWGTEILSPKDGLFKMVLMSNEQRVEAFENLKHTGFLWFVQLHFQLDTFAVMLRQLCQRPTGSLLDRAWAVTEHVYGHYAELHDMSQRRYATLAQVTLDAWKVRERAHVQAGRALQKPQFLTHLQELVASSHEHPWSTQSLGTCPTLPPSEPDPHQPSYVHSQPQNAEMDLSLSGYPDIASLEWDFLGDIRGDTGDQLPAAIFSDSTGAACLQL